MIFLIGSPAARLPGHSATESSPRASCSRRSAVWSSHSDAGWFLAAAFDAFARGRLTAQGAAGGRADCDSPGPARPAPNSTPKELFSRVLSRRAVILMGGTMPTSLDRLKFEVFPLRTDPNISGLQTGIHASRLNAPQLNGCLRCAQGATAGRPARRRRTSGGGCGERP